MTGSRACSDTVVTIVIPFYASGLGGAQAPAATNLLNSFCRVMHDRVARLEHPRKLHNARTLQIRYIGPRTEKRWKGKKRWEGTPGSASTREKVEVQTATDSCGMTIV